jgi:hypothetical protein
MRIKFFTGQTTGVAETFVLHPTSETDNCKGTGGLAFCQVHTLVPQLPNWVLHTTTTDITVTLTDITYDTTGAFCPHKQITTTAAPFKLTPNQPETFSSFQGNGTSTVDVNTTSGTVDKAAMEIRGTLNVESPYANTYSI